MTTSTNSTLEEGIQEVMRLSDQVARLAIQENSLRGLAGVLETLTNRLSGVREQLQELDTSRERMKWKKVWIALAGIGLLQISTLIVLIFKA